MNGSKIKSFNSLGKQKVYSLTMKSDQHNYLLYDENRDKAVISRNSHAVAYTYITSRLLYLKAHYPLEFYAGLLMLEKDSDKIKEYKTEALIHGVAINGVDINKSNVRFDICEEENEIYFGLDRK